MQFLSIISVAAALAAPALAQTTCQVRLLTPNGGVCATFPFTTAPNTVIPLPGIPGLPNCSVQVNAEAGQTCRYFVNNVGGCGGNRDFTFGVAGTIGC